MTFKSEYGEDKWIYDNLGLPHPSKGIYVEFRENCATSRISNIFQHPKHPAVTLQSLLDKHGITKIDFMSIDIEGAEFDAFQTFTLPWPRVIVAEYNTADLGKDFRLFEQIIATGRYAAVYRTVANIIYTWR